MSGMGKLLRGETNIGFVRDSNRWFTGSGILVAVSLLAVLFLGHNFGVDFKGRQPVWPSWPHPLMIGAAR